MANMSIITPEEFRSLRREFGLSVDQMAELVKVQGRTVRRWEDETRDIPGVIGVLLLAAKDNAAVRQYFGLTLRAEREAVA